MPLIWDDQLQAFRESESPLTYDPDIDAFRESTGYVPNLALEWGCDFVIGFRTS